MCYVAHSQAPSTDSTTCDSFILLILLSFYISCTLSTLFFLFSYLFIFLMLFLTQRLITQSPDLRTNTLSAALRQSQQMVTSLHCSLLHMNMSTQRTSEGATALAKRRRTDAPTRTHSTRDTLRYNTHELTRHNHLYEREHTLMAQSERERWGRGADILRDTPHFHIPDFIRLLHPSHPSLGHTNSRNSSYGGDIDNFYENNQQRDNMDGFPDKRGD